MFVKSEEWSIQKDTRHIFYLYITSFIATVLISLKLHLINKADLGLKWYCLSFLKHKLTFLWSKYNTSFFNISGPLDDSFANFGPEFGWNCAYKVGLNKSRTWRPALGWKSERGRRKGQSLFSVHEDQIWIFQSWMQMWTLYSSSLFEMYNEGNRYFLLYFW